MPAPPAPGVTGFTAVSSWAAMNNYTTVRHGWHLAVSPLCAWDDYYDSARMPARTGWITARLVKWTEH